MNGKNDTIRVAILCKGNRFESWEAESIRQVLSLPFVKIVLRIEEDSEPEEARGFPAKLFHYPYSRLLWRWHKRFRISRIPAMQTEDLSALLKDVPSVSCRPELRKRNTQFFSETDLEKIRSYAPDLMLRFGFNILGGEILNIAPHGIWSFHHADPEFLRGGPAAFWEIRKRNPVTGAMLQRLTEKLDAGILIRSGWFRTINRSHRANLQQLLQGTVSWMKQGLIDLHNGKRFEEQAEIKQVKAPFRTFPGNGNMLLCWWITRMNKLRFHFRSLFCAEQWNIGILHQPASSLLHGPVTAPEWLPDPPPGEFYADPFGWKENGKLSILFEHYDYRRQKGLIYIHDTNGIQPWLERPQHLSYPFILPGEKRKIIPECFESGKLLCIDPENRNEPSVLLDDFAAVDPSIFEWNGKWWLFCTCGNDYSNTELYIFHAGSPEGKWTAHANNPVKSDIRSARPAGTPFMHEGKIYRPAQDCSTTYGAAVVLQEITLLSENAFSEKEIRRIAPKPDWKYNKGLHTLSVVDENTLLIDAKRYGFNFGNFAAALKRKLKRLTGK